MLQPFQRLGSRRHELFMEFAFLFGLQYDFGRWQVLTTRCISFCKDIFHYGDQRAVPMRLRFPTLRPCCKGIIQRSWRVTCLVYNLVVDLMQLNVFHVLADVFNFATGSFSASWFNREGVHVQQSIFASANWGKCELPWLCQRKESKKWWWAKLSPSNTPQ